jgi:uncharacterized protein
MEENLAHDIRVLFEWAEKNPVVIRIWIFGSRSRGDHREDSDLDIAIEHGILPEDASWESTAFCGPKEWRSELQPLTKHRLDVQSYDPKPDGRVSNSVAQCSILVYSKNT